VTSERKNGVQPIGHTESNNSNSSLDFHRQTAKTYHALHLHTHDMQA